MHVPAELSPAPDSIDPIAQTILQLYRQLERRGYGPDDLYHVRRGYDLAVSVMACQYRSSGRSLVEHMLGTASTVASLGADATLVAATVAHAAYVHGDFGTMGRRIGPAQRARVRDAVGGAADDIIQCYSALYLNAKSIPALHQRAKRLEGVERDAITIRVADQLDLYGTMEVLYLDNAPARREFARSFGPMIADIADGIGYPQLGSALRSVYADVLGRTIPAALESPPWRDGLILPASHRVKPAVALYRSVRTQVWRWTGR